MQTPIRSDSTTRKRQTVPWWKTQLSLFKPEPGVPERAADDPPAVPDRTTDTPRADVDATGCPGTLPKHVRDVYVSVFGLPALHPENMPETAVSRPVDASSPRAEVVA